MRTVEVNPPKKGMLVDDFGQYAWFFMSLESSQKVRIKITF